MKFHVYPRWILAAISTFSLLSMLFSTVTFAQAGLDQDTKADIIEQIVQELSDKYVFPDIAAEMSALLERNLATGAYDAISDARTFAETLTEDLRSVSHDLHLSVDYLAGFAAASPSEPIEDYSGNSAFVRVETLPGNVGYLDFRAFVPPTPEAKRVAVGAMAFLSSTDAIIIDLRKNSGGSPEMVRFITSYLFGLTPVHLSDIYDRIQDTTTEYWTLEDIPLSDARIPDTPVFVLVSNQTFSGAEEFSYNLQSLDRATIIGEVTGGGAHPTTCTELIPDFGICVPFARSINPITGTNWEGTGVTPDILTTADDAYDRAYELAQEAAAERRAAREAQWERDHQPNNDLDIDGSVLERYVGTYRNLTEGWTLKVELRNGTFIGVFPWGPEPLLPITETTFFVDPFTRLEFVVEDDGTISGARAVFRPGTSQDPFVREN